MRESETEVAFRVGRVRAQRIWHPFGMHVDFRSQCPVVASLRSLPPANCCHPFGMEARHSRSCANRLNNGTICKRGLVIKQLLRQILDLGLAEVRARLYAHAAWAWYPNFLGVTICRPGRADLPCAERCRFHYFLLGGLGASK